MFCCLIHDKHVLAFFSYVFYAIILYLLILFNRMYAGIDGPGSGNLLHVFTTTNTLLLVAHACNNPG